MMITLAEAARKTGLSPATLRRHILSGLIPALDLRPPGARHATWRLKEEDIEAWVRDCRSKAGVK